MINKNNKQKANNYFLTLLAAKTLQHPAIVKQSFSLNNVVTQATQFQKAKED
jgi:hypothetical protein